jgi:hypothetical protein
MMGVVLAGGACRLFSPDAEIVFGQGGLEIGCGGKLPGGFKLTGSARSLNVRTAPLCHHGPYQENESFFLRLRPPSEFPR